MLYFDNNATTKPFPEALECFNNAAWYNPHSTHFAGQIAEKDIEEAKQSIAKDIGCKINEIFFVSSPTEACNWAISIMADKHCKFIYNHYEHSGVLKPLLAFEQNPNPIFERNGYVQMLVNNIYGEIYDIPERENDSDLIFCDGTAAIGHIPFNFETSGIDLLAFGAHKFNGLRGAACLIIKESLLPVRSLVWGGDITGGTPCSGLIKAMAVALHKNIENLNSNIAKNTEMRDFLIQELLKIPDSHLNGPAGNRRAPNNVNISFKGILGSQLQAYLSEDEICVSTGSACDSSSYVEQRGGICFRPLDAQKKRKPELVSIFEAGNLKDPEYSIRITLDANYNTMDECKYLVKCINYLISIYG